MLPLIFKKTYLIQLKYIFIFSFSPLSGDTICFYGVWFAMTENKWLKIEKKKGLSDSVNIFQKWLLRHERLSFLSETTTAPLYCNIISEREGMSRDPIAL